MNHLYNSIVAAKGSAFTLADVEAFVAESGLTSRVAADLLDSTAPKRDRTGEPIHPSPSLDDIPWDALQVQGAVPPQMYRQLRSVIRGLERMPVTIRYIVRTNYGTIPGRFSILLSDLRRMTSEEFDAYFARAVADEPNQDHWLEFETLYAYARFHGTVVAPNEGPVVRRVVRNHTFFFPLRYGEELIDKVVEALERDARVT